MFNDFEVVKLSKDFPEHNLKEGDLGSILLQVSKYDYEVEFVGEDGNPVAVLTLQSGEIERLT